MTEKKVGYHVGGTGDGSVVGVPEELITPEEHVRLEEEWLKECSLWLGRYGGWQHAERLLVARKVYGYAYGLPPRIAAVEPIRGVRR